MRGGLVRSKENAKEYGNKSGCWCLIPVILAIWEAEVRRIGVSSQPRQIVFETLSGKCLTQKELME
jgi:hypothetical protein